MPRVFHPLLLTHVSMDDLISSHECSAGVCDFPGRESRLNFLPRAPGLAVRSAHCQSPRLGHWRFCPTHTRTPLTTSLIPGSQSEGRPELTWGSFIHGRATCSLCFTSDHVLKTDRGQGVSKGGHLSVKEAIRKTQLIPDSTGPSCSEDVSCLLEKKIRSQR